MKALSIRQPYLNLILRGRKTIEVRRRGTSHRGDLLLCAARTPALPQRRMDELQQELGLPYCYGHALCLVKVAGSRPLAPGDERAAWISAIDTRLFGWLLEAIRPVVPFPVRGQLGLFTVADSLVRLAASPLQQSLRSS